ncbi:hypothetical protein MKZ38_002447 [Zalerion maritima]|uniref:Uncharacterized protein n=1 Tax=Zalerion maritima TaxID=339359 RepID=A0AAD5WT52_9PEZI|nr:hypothetical protein MKZ38_002447 [Zalerion maritima]
MESNLANTLKKVFHDPDPAWTTKSLRAIYKLFSAEVQEALGITQVEIDHAFRNARLKIFRSYYSRRGEPGLPSYMTKEYAHWYGQRLLCIYYERKLAKAFKEDTPKLRYKAINEIPQPIFNHVPEHLRNGATGHVYESTEYWFWAGHRKEEIKGQQKDRDEVVANMLKRKSRASPTPPWTPANKRLHSNSSVPAPLSTSPGEATVRYPTGLASPPVTPENAQFLASRHDQPEPIPFNLPALNGTRKNPIDLTESPSISRAASTTESAGHRDPDDIEMISPAEGT